MIKQCLIVAVALVVLSLAFFSCSNGSIPVGEQKVLVPLIKHNMGIKVDGITFDGIGAVPLENRAYNIHLKSKVKLDRFILRSCQREVVIDSAWNVEEVAGWFIFKHKKEKENEITFEYTPSWIERQHCPVTFEVISKEATVSTGLLIFFDPDFKQKAVVSCNGVEKEYVGASFCDVREGLEQSINFGEEKVTLSPDASCDFGQKEGKYFQFKVKKADCAYIFKSESGKIHEFITRGYDQAFQK